MKSGRKRDDYPPVKWTLTLPLDLTAAIELRLHDPVHKKPQYGARSLLIEQLLREWLEKQRLKDYTLPQPENSNAD